MTKKAMMDEMVAFGMIPVQDVNYYLRRGKDTIERLYKEKLPKRKEWLKKNGLIKED